MSRGIGGGALLLLKTLVLRSFQIVHVMSIVREDMDLRLGVAKKDILDHQDLRELYKTNTHIQIRKLHQTNIQLIHPAQRVEKD
jgi:hypothetical protein